MTDDPTPPTDAQSSNGTGSARARSGRALGFGAASQPGAGDARRLRHGFARGCSCAIRSRCSCCSPRSGWRSRSPLLLGAIKPSSCGQAGADQHRADARGKRHEIGAALLLDHDNRVEVPRRSRRRGCRSRWAAGADHDTRGQGRHGKPGIRSPTSCSLRPPAWRSPVGLLSGLGRADPAAAARTRRRAARSSRSTSSRARGRRRSSSSS